MPIKNTGDNGSVNEKVQNKNLFDENTVTFTVGVLDDNGNPTGSTASHYTNNFYQVTPNTNYTLKGTLNSGSSSGRIYYYDKDKKWISRSAGFAGTSYTFITPNNCYYIRIQVGLAVTLKTGDVQLEQGSTATDYVPHSEQNLSFPLVEGQKLMEGDYLADDGVHHKWGEVVLDGVTNGKKFATFYLNYNNRGVISISGIKLGVDYRENTALCSHFKYNITVYKDALDEVGFIVNNDGKIFIRFGSSSEINTLEKANNWLAEQYANGTPVKVQYQLAEEVIEPYTEEQKEAWEQIKKARTYKNITHISSEDETPANVEIEYVRDLETVINNLTTRVETIESEV